MAGENFSVSLIVFSLLMAVAIAVLLHPADALAEECIAYEEHDREGMICKLEAGGVPAAAPLEDEDENPVQETRPREPLDNEPINLTTDRDRQQEIAETERRVQAIEDSIKRLQDAVNEILGTPDEVGRLKNALDEKLKGMSAAELADTMGKTQQQTGANGSPLDFLKNLLGNTGLTGMSNDSAINPNGSGQRTSNGYNPWGSSKGVAALNGRQGTIPADTSGEICVYSPYSNANFNGNVQDLINNKALMQKIFNSSEMDPNLVVVMAGIHKSLSACHPDKRICQKVVSGYRSPQANAAAAARNPRVSKKSNHMHHKAVDIEVPGIDNVTLRNTSWCQEGIGEVGYYGNKMSHVHIGTVKQGAWSTSGVPRWNPNFTCDQYACDKVASNDVKPQ